VITDGSVDAFPPPSPVIKAVRILASSYLGVALVARTASVMLTE
jgi:hypothetical protein